MRSIPRAFLAATLALLSLPALPVEALEPLQQAERPQWNVGDVWTYNITADLDVRGFQGAGNGRMNRTILAREETPNGSVWVFGNRTIINGAGYFLGAPVPFQFIDNTTQTLDAATLGRVHQNTTQVQQSPGLGIRYAFTTVTNVSAPQYGYRFPFRVGDQWNASFTEQVTRTWEDGTMRAATATVQVFTSVERAEALEVEGRAYRTFVLLTDSEPADTDGQYLLQWWAPEVGNTVRDVMFYRGKPQLIANLSAFRYGAAVLGYEPLRPADGSQPPPQPEGGETPGPGFIPLALATGAAALLAARRLRR